MTLFKKAVNEKAGLFVYYDDCPSNPRKEFDNMGTFVGCGEYGESYNETFNNERDFLQYMAEDFIDTDIAQEYMKKQAEIYFAKEYEILPNEDEEEGGFIIESESYYSPFNDYVYNTMQEAEEALTSEKAEWIEDVGNLDELDDHEIHDIVEQNMILFETDFGFNYCTYETVKKEYGAVTEENIEKARKYLQTEQTIYEQYCEGDVFGYRLIEITDKEGLFKYMEENELDFDDLNADTLEEFGKEDSCWGFYGDDFINNGMGDQVGKEYIDLLKELEYAYN